MIDSDINSTTISTDDEEIVADSDNDLISTAFDEKNFPVENESSSSNGLTNVVGQSNSCRFLISSHNESPAPLIMINDVPEIGSPEGGLNKSWEIWFERCVFSKFCTGTSRYCTEKYCK